MGAVAMLVRCLAAATLLAALVRAELIDGSFTISSGDFDHFPMIELKRFTFGVGKGRISGKVTYDTMTLHQNFFHSPALLLFDDSKWEAYHDNRKYPSCQDKGVLASQMIKIGETSHGDAGVADTIKAAKVTSHVDDVDGTTTFSFQWEIEHEARAHSWYLVASDCALEQNQGQDDMAYEITFLGEGGTQLSAEDGGMVFVYLAAVVMMGLGGVYGAYLTNQHLEETQRGIHLVVRLLAAAYCVQCLSIGLESMHLTLIEVYGAGSFLMDTVAEICEGLATLLISFILICLASGWTLVESSEDRNRVNSVATILRDPKLLFRGFNLAVALVLVMLTASVCLIIFNKQGDGDFRKFHDHESFAGRLLIALRLFLGAYFAFSLVTTLRSQRQHSHLSKDQTMESFLKSLLFLGTSYFLIFPIVVYIAEVFLPHYERHFFVETSVITVQCAIMAALAYQFLAKSSVYRRLSTVWESGMLPTAGGLAKPTKGHVE